MVQVPQRATIRGPTFIRLLARLTSAEAPQSDRPLPDLLSQWLDWTHAIALSTALDGQPAEHEQEAASAEHEVRNECAQARATLAEAIAEKEWKVAGARAVGDLYAADGAQALPIDYAVFRQRCLALQRQMQATTGRLRGRLRDALARKSTEMARLAEVDALMERALSPREQTLLAAVPGLLGARFERLRQASSEAKPVPAMAHGAWLETFRNDMRELLLAELDVRFQPIDGLLAALRAD